MVAFKIRKVQLILNRLSLQTNYYRLWNMYLLHHWIVNNHFKWFVISWCQIKKKEICQLRDDHVRSTRDVILMHIIILWTHIMQVKLWMPFTNYLPLCSDCKITLAGFIFCKSFLFLKKFGKVLKVCMTSSLYCRSHIYANLRIPIIINLRRKRCR